MIQVTARAAHRRAAPASLFAAAASLVAWPAMAHEGHGASGLHWHASDTLGFVLVTVVAVVALWLGRGR
ncbi:MAG: hypothetical protein EBU07_09175 [Betaproteobacteria bacterium]|nr:hypothetical protein [Betaproteobacteria bacterium]